MRTQLDMVGDSGSIPLARTILGGVAGRRRPECCGIAAASRLLRWFYARNNTSRRQPEDSSIAPFRWPTSPPSIGPVSPRRRSPAGSTAAGRHLGRGRSRRRRQHRHGQGSGRSRDHPPLDGASCWRTRCRSCFRTRRSPSVRSSRTAFTTILPTSARSRPRTSPPSRSAWPRLRPRTAGAPARAAAR